MLECVPTPSFAVLSVVFSGCFWDLIYLPVAPLPKSSPSLLQAGALVRAWIPSACPPASQITLSLRISATLPPLTRLRLTMFALPPLTLPSLTMYASPPLTLLMHLRRRYVTDGLLGKTVLNFWDQMLQHGCPPYWKHFNVLCKLFPSS